MEQKNPVTYRVEIRNGDFWSSTGYVFDSEAQAREKAERVAKESEGKTRVVAVKPEPTEWLS